MNSTPFVFTVTANFTAEPLGDVLRFWAGRVGLDPARILFSGYNQVLQALTDPAGPLSTSEPGANFLLLRPEDWARHQDSGRRAATVEAASREFATAVSGFATRARRPTLVLLCPPSRRALADPELAPSLARAEAGIREALSACRIPLLTTADLAALYPVPLTEDAASDRHGHIPFTPDWWTAAGTLLMRHARALLQRPGKVIAVDADNTLWGGVAAEAGPAQVDLSGPWRETQQFLLDRKRQGMLLVLLSKNREEDVEAVFARPDMILRRDDFVLWKVNWQPKSQNLFAAAAELNLGPDSFLFLDDNPVECGEVAAHCPRVTVLPLPATDPAAFLRHVWAFDLPPATATDAGRTVKYREQAERARLLEASPSFADFFARLELHIELAAPAPAQFERAAQLTRRTNQFHTTGLRRTTAELTALLASGERQALLVTVRDRFGDYGEVGLCIYRFAGPVLEADTFLLSCRALGKGVEHRLLAALGRLAREAGKTSVTILFTRGDRNEPAARFLESVGHAFRENGGYRFPAAVAESVAFDPGQDAPAASAEPAPAQDRIPPAACDFALLARTLQTVPAIQFALRQARFRPRPDLAIPYAAPRTATEQTLAALWADTLGLDRVGIHDDFFDLGGDSIRGVQLLSAAHEAGLAIPLQQLFEHPRIASLAENLPPEALHRSTEPAPAIAEDPVSPLSPLQQGMLFQSLQSPGSGVCFEQNLYTLRGPLDPDAFARAWEQAIARHASLRTTFVWDDAAEPRQIVHPAGLLDFHQEDWRHLSPPDQEIRLDEFRAADRRRGFDLTALPLLRLALFRLAGDCHQLVWSFHHTILDGWSLPVVLRDVLAFYEAAVTGIPAYLPAPVPYRAFLAWQRRQDPARAEAHWRRRLAGYTETTPLAVERRTAPAEPATGETFRSRFHQLPARVTATLHEFARRHQLTTGTLVQGAWALLLGRYATAEEVVFGCNLSGRPPELPGVGEIVGLCINTLPLRVPTSASPVLAWLRGLQAQVLETLDYSFSSLADVRRYSDLRPGQPLFDTIVVIENYPPLQRKSGHQPEVSYQSWTKHSKTGYPLTLLALPGDELRLEIQFDDRLFDVATVDRMLRHLATLLQGLAADPDRALDDVPLLEAAERHELLVGFNTPTAATSRFLLADGGATLHQLFEAQAARRPDALALTGDGIAVTYAELNAKANRIASRLLPYGFGPDTLVGLCMDRGPHLVTALLGILKAGAAYLPLDLAYPADRLAFIVEDAQAPVLLTQTHLAARLPPTGARLLCIEDLLRNAADEDAPSLSVPSHPDHLAYVIYTSGTTGKPKGSLITHRNVTRLFASTDHWFGFGEHDVWTLFHSCAFDFSVWEIWGALLYGGRLVVVPFLVSRSPELFYHLLADENVTVLNQTPSAFRQLVQAEEQTPARSLALRYVIFGGEALEMQSLQPWFARHGDRTPRLVNMYGITETTVHVTYRPLSKDDLAGGSVIGTPIPDLQLYILDPRRRPVPIGVPGELYVGGAGLARGYLRRPELTAERFLPDHLTGQPNARLYRTGDLARYLPCGDIEYLGRLDSQVKIRGFRIELGEIEAVLRRHAGVREAVVLARETSPGNKRLVAWLVAGLITGHPAPEPAALREHLKQKLPDYMVPAAFVFLDKLPLTNNGKIDRKALPEPEEHRPELTALYVAPRTDTERALATIWAKVLRLETVGVHDNFFELGGDSILSIQIVSLARREHLPLTPALLFAHQTIAELAQALAVATRPQAAPSEPETESGPVPLTPMQHWFFSGNPLDPHHYNQSFLLELREPVPPALLEQALQLVSEQHDALRLQHAVSLTLADLACLDETAAATQASLDLDLGPHWRAVLFSNAAGQRDRLLLAIHHLAVDGVSWRPLLEDLETACRALRDGTPVRLPAKTSSFALWARRLRELAESGALDGELPWWRSVTDAIPQAFPPPADNTEAGAVTTTCAFTADETQALLQLVPAAYNTQINDVLLTALARAWQLWTGQNTLFTNLEGHGREDLFPDLDLSRTVGWFTSLFPVRLELPAVWQPGEALQSIKEQLRRIPGRGIGYGILRYLRQHPDLQDQPEPALVFNYLGQFDQALAASTLFAFAPEPTGPWHSPRQQRRHTLEVNCLVLAGRLEFQWSYPGSLAEPDAVPAFRDHFLRSLRELTDHCRQPGTFGRTPSDFPLVRLDQSAVNRLTNAHRDLVDILPLSPLQTLFLSAGQATFDQWQATLQGDLDPVLLRHAWRETLRRHTILRTSVHTDGLAEPVQIVHRDADPSWTLEDWRALDPAQHETAWADFLRRDRSRPLPLSDAPLMRFALIRLRHDTAKFLWSVPALLLDGWSWPLVFRDVSRIYARLSGQPATTGQPAHGPDPVRPYRDYLAWLTRQNQADAQAFWTRQLAGFTRPTALPTETTGEPSTEPATERYRRQEVLLPAEPTRALHAFARRLQVTPGALVQAAWALLLARQTGDADLVFGAAFSGRPADLPAVETIAGPFVNNLPVRVTADPAASLDDFLRHVHAQLLALNPFQFTPLVEIQRCTEVPWRYRLFDSLVVFQNYLVDDAARRLGNGIELLDFEGPVHTSFPVLLLAEPGNSLRLLLLHDRTLLSAATAERWLADLFTLLRQFPDLAARRLAEVQDLLSPPVRTPPRPARPALRTTREYVPPQTSTERLIAGIWAPIFGVETIGVEENFFDLGAHSLLLVHAHAQLRAALGTSLPLVALFEFPTIRSLARHLTAAPAAKPDTGQQFRDLAGRRKQALARLRAKSEI